jgi:hypothetical protein
MVLVDYTGIFFLHFPIFLTDDYTFSLNIYTIFFIFMLNFIFMHRKKIMRVLFMIHQKDIEMFSQ